MPRPTNKTDLIISANEQFDKLQKLINSMSTEQQNNNFGFEDRDKNLRDVLIHLYEWHQLLLNWVDTNKAGVAKHFLPEPYNWRTYPQMNIKFWEKHQETPLIDAKEMLYKSHNKIMKLIDILSNEELFTKKYFTWTDGLGTYFVSATSSHYNWAIKKIKKHLK